MHHMTYMLPPYIATMHDHCLVTALVVSQAQQDVSVAPRTTRAMPAAAY